MTDAELDAFLSADADVVLALPEARMIAFQAAIRERLNSLSELVKSCAWSDPFDGDDEDSGTYRTACGHEFTMGEDSDSPRRWMTFCCYCGGRVSYPLPEAPK